MQLTPEQFASLKQVLSEPAGVAAAVLKLPTDQVDKMLERLQDITEAQAAGLKGERFLVIYSPGVSNRRPFDRAAIKDVVQKQTFILTVGDDCTLVSAATGIVDAVSASKYSENGPSLVALCSANQISVYVAGKPIADLSDSQGGPIGRSDWMMPATELRDSFDLHFKHCIENQKLVSYWGDRKKRILAKGQDGTEKLFHHCLFWWCKHFVSDALTVFGETLGLGQDKTDITIVTEVALIVVEVKWLGTNGTTEFKEDRIEAGMVQVIDYLNRDSALSKGYLVLYDGRSEEDCKTKRSFSSNHVKCESPIFYFLRSETPSERADRLAAAMVKANKQKSKKAK